MLSQEPKDLSSREGGYHVEKTKLPELEGSLCRKKSCGHVECRCDNTLVKLAEPPQDKLDITIEHGQLSLTQVRAGRPL